MDSMHTDFRHGRFAPQRERVGKKLRIPSIAFFFCGFVLVGGIVFLLFFSSFTAIQFIDVTATDGIDASAVRTLVFQQMNESRAKLFSQKNIFVLSQKELEERLRREFVIDEFSMIRKPPRTISLKISGKPFRLVWIGNNQLWDVASDGSLSRLLDANAPISLYVRARMIPQQHQPAQKNEKEWAEIPLVVDQDMAAHHSVGDKVLSSDTLRFMLELWHGLGALGIHPLTSSIESNSPTVTVYTAEGWYALFSVLSDPVKQAEHARLILDRYFKQKRNGLQYIDVRFDDRLYFK